MLDWTDRPAALTFDLHGQTVLEAASSAEQFLRIQAKARPGGIVRIITGRGLSGPGGGSPIRTRVRGLLRRLKESAAVVRDYRLEDSAGSFLVRLRGRGG
jgi:DNA-nicking Smr family endonuclease